MKLITYEESDKLIKLLHKDYQEDVNITLMHSNLNVLFTMLRPKHLKNIDLMCILNYIRYNTLGLQAENSIYLFLHNFKNLDERASIQELRLLAAKTLFHEIRHIYQQRYKAHKIVDDYIFELGNGYLSQWDERDANHFAFRMMNKHKEDINTILNIDFEWDIIWETLYIK
jgi:hypothetical protein